MKKYALLGITAALAIALFVVFNWTTVLEADDTPADNCSDRCNYVYVGGSTSYGWPMTDYVTAQQIPHADTIDPGFDQNDRQLVRLVQPVGLLVDAWFCIGLAAAFSAGIWLANGIIRGKVRVHR